MMTIAEQFDLYFEDGIYITAEEQMLHNIAVKKAQRETARFIAKMVISMNNKFATIERNRHGSNN